MRIAFIAGLALAVSLTAGPSRGQDTAKTCACCQEKTKTADPLDTILETLQARAKGLQHYQCKIDYVFKQPLLDSQTRRQGMLYYTKIDQRSYLRIDFETVQYDDEKEMKHREQFFFDGVWGTYIDYEGRNVQRQQVAEPNAPVDAFSLVSQRVPVLGFSKIEDLREQFAIELVAGDGPEAAASHQLHMVVKPDSAYREDYTTIDCRIDKKLGLPTRIVAATTEQDVHDIQLLDARTNRPVPRKHFAMEVPADFSVEAIPLQRNRTGR